MPVEQGPFRAAACSGRAAPPLATSPHHVTIAAHLAVILGTAGAIALIQGSASAHRSSISLIATLANPIDGYALNLDASGAVAFSPDGKTLAESSGDTSVYLWDVATSRRIAAVTDPGTGVFSLAWSPDRTTLAVVDFAGSTYLLHLPTGHQIATFSSPGEPGGPRRPRSARTARRWPPATAMTTPACGTSPPGT